jgi:MFS transporter, ACS family, tartrate transporter
LASSAALASSAVAERARRRIAVRLMPFLFILYIIAFLDRVNVSYAALDMVRDLGFSDRVLGDGLGIFFVGYFLLEIPGTIIVERWSARKWIARIMISWGILATWMGFIHGKTEFYWIRFFLGAAEAGFFPGIIVYLSHWFRYEDRAKAVALFMSAIPVSNILGAPVSGLILGVNWLGIPGWRWVFIVEGIPAVILGVVTLFYLTDWPREAKWLPEDERRWISEELERERAAKRKARPLSILQAMRQPEVLLLVAAYFLVVTGYYGFTLWLPTLIKRLSGLPNLVVTLVAMIPYLAGLVAMLAVGWHSDRTGERRWHCAVPMAVGGIALALGTLAADYLVVAIALFAIVAAGALSYLPAFWALPTAFLTESAAAAAIGLINSFGNLGGFVGPYVVGYLSTATGSFNGGMLCLAASMMLGSIVILRIRHHHRATPP